MPESEVEKTARFFRHLTCGAMMIPFIVIGGLLFTLFTVLACCFLAAMWGAARVQPTTVPAQHQEDSRMSEEEMLDFMDNTAKFKGKTLTLRASVWWPDFQLATLRDCVGKEVDLTRWTRTDGKLEVKVMLPAGLDLPNAKRGDDLLVTFECQKGSLKEGNIATKIVSDTK
jgi:hypothetical protein